MRFAADAMLGRLARWLRLLGYDTLYTRDIADSALLRVALQEERVILTRDTRLYERKAARGRSFLIDSDDPHEQLLQVIRRFPPPEKTKLLPSRCPLCNGPLRRVADKAKLQDSLPEHVYISQKKFLRCASCGHIYWEGSHYGRLKKTLNDIIKKDKGR